MEGAVTTQPAPPRQAASISADIPPERRVTAIRDYNHFATLHGDWNRLASTHPAPSRFLSFEWTDAAWQWCRHEGSPLILAATIGGRLVGLLPLLERRRRRFGLGGRRLQSLVIPDNQAWDLIAAAPDVEAVAALFADWLARHADLWRELRLRLLRADSPGTAALYQALRRRRLDPTLDTIGPNYVIPVTGSWEAYYRTRSRRLKKGNNLIANHLAGVGEPRLEWRRGNDVDAATLDLLAELSTASWKRDTGTTLDHPGPAAFFRRLGEHGLGADWLSVWILWLDDRPLAAELQLLDGNRVHGLRADYREDATDLSPGTYLNWKITEGLFGQGFATYYLGLGENPYKRRWTNDGPPLQRLTAYSPRPLGRALRLLSGRLLPAIRGLRERIAARISRP